MGREVTCYVVLALKIKMFIVAQDGDQNWSRVNTVMIVSSFWVITGRVVFIGRRLGTAVGSIFWVD